MPVSLRQDTRTAKLETPLGTDKLTLVGFRCVEGLNEPFEFEIDAISRDKDIDFNVAIGSHCTVTFTSVEHGKRYFDGMLVKTRWTGRKKDTHKYRLTLRPWLWLLSFRKNCLIFHEKTAPQIIREIFDKHGFAKFSIEASRNYPVMEYCVQYRESDMAFVCRLMEQHGISYYFEHSDGEHKLILADEIPSYKTVPGGRRRYVENVEDHLRDKEMFYSWSAERRFTSGKVTLKEFDFKKPSADLTAEETGDAEFENGKLEVYDYPGEYVERSDGSDYARAFVNSERGPDGHFHASGNCASCFPGALVTIEGHPIGEQNVEYLILKAIHEYSDQTYRSDAAAGEGEAYQGVFEFIKSDKPYAPPRVTAKPFIRGPQTAKVVGEGDIDVDEYGRILVRFHWDGKDDQSMRCRVAQVWSGREWGGIYIPRVDMEAVVQFLEGDPDQPLVIGTVYNDENMPPYPLPDERNIAGVKSQSTPSGDGYNEFVFDDSAGRELIRMHAEKDLEVLVENDEKRTVKHDRETTIGNNDTLDVTNVLKIDAGVKIEMTVGASKITMTPSKITIEALSIEVSAQSYKTSALTSEHSAAALMDIKGAIVKINT